MVVGEGGESMSRFAGLWLLFAIVVNLVGCGGNGISSGGSTGTPASTGGVVTDTASGAIRVDGKMQSSKANSLISLAVTPTSPFVAQSTQQALVAMGTY